MTRSRLDPFRLALVLATLGTVFVHTWTSGQVKTLLHPMLQPFVLGTGLILLAAAALHLALGPESFGVPPRIFWKNAVRDLCVVVAVAGAVALAPHSFSSLALVNRTGTDPAAALRGKTAAPDTLWQSSTGPDGAIKLETADLFMAVQTPAVLAELDGRKVRFIGQFVTSPESASAGAGDFKIVRFLMFCCAADAQPVAVAVHSSQPLPPLAPMAWAEVTGVVHFPEVSPGKREPVLTLDTVKAIPEPSDKYLY